MLSEGLAPWSLSCLRMFTGFFPGNMRVCGHWAGDWCSPCIGAGFDTLTFQSPRKFFGTVNLATFAVPRSFVAQ